MKVDIAPLQFSFDTVDNKVEALEADFDSAFLSMTEAAQQNLTQAALSVDSAVLSH